MRMANFAQDLHLRGLVREYELDASMKLIDVLKNYSSLSTTAVSDAMGGSNSMVGIKPIVEGSKLCGVALTVRPFLGDEKAVHVAIEDYAKNGDVIVVDACGIGGVAIGGGLMARKCVKKGVRGMVIDGSTRDVEDIRKIGFPVFAKGLNPSSAASKSNGKINVPIQCGGIVVEPGDILVGDDNGVVVVDRERVEEVLRKAVDIELVESEYIKSLEKGEWKKADLIKRKLKKIKAT